MAVSVHDLVHKKAAVPLATLVESWVAAGIISAEQARRMTATGDVAVAVEPVDEGGRSPKAPILAIEALGYLGGVVVLVSTILIMNLYWRDLSGGTRTTVLGVASAALVGAGLATSPRLGGVGVRLRSVLWLAATGALAGFLALLTDEVLELDAADAFVIASAGTAAGAAGLWSLHRVLPQQVATMVALMVSAAALVNDLAPGHDSLPGVGVWAVAATWLLLGWGSVLGPRPAVLPLAAAGLILGAMTTLPSDAGFLLAIGTVMFVVALAVLLTDLLLLAVGALGTLMVLPAAVIEWFPDSNAVPFVLLAIGLLLVLVAVWTARRRRERPRGPERDWGRLPTRAAVAAAVGVLAAAAAVVTAVGFG